MPYKDAQITYTCAENFPAWPLFSDNGIYFEAHSKSAPASSTTGTPAPESCYYPPVRLLSGTVVSLFTEKCSNGLAKCILGLALRSPSCDYRLAWPDAASIVRPQKQVVARDFAAGSSRYETAPRDIRSLAAALKYI